MGAAGTFELFDVSLTEGSVAPPFQVPDYASELALCQRYWWASSPTTPKGGTTGKFSGAAITTSVLMSNYRYAVPMRSTPTIQVWTNNLQNQVRTSTTGTMLPVGAPTFFSDTLGGALATFSGTAMAVGTWYDFDFFANARL